jgi:hypothetical protein
MVMPHLTERQQAADALHHAYLLSLIIENEAEISQKIEHFNSSSGSNLSTLTSESLDAGSKMQPMSEAYLHYFNNL